MCIGYEPNSQVGLDLNVGETELESGDPTHISYTTQQAAHG